MKKLSIIFLLTACYPIADKTQFQTISNTPGEGWLRCKPGTVMEVYIDHPEGSEEKYMAFSKVRCVKDEMKIP